MDIGPLYRDPPNYDPMMTGVFEDWDDLADWEKAHGPCPEGTWVIAGLPYRVADGKAVPVRGT